MEEEKGKGRPPHFTSPEELQEEIDSYFFDQKESKSAATITGLAYHLGFASRQSFYDYEKDGDFSYTIKRARLKIESIYEAKLSGNNAAGPIFALKNFGWTDKQEVDHKNNGGNFEPFVLVKQYAKPDNAETTPEH